MHLGAAKTSQSLSKYYSEDFSLSLIRWRKPAHFSQSCILNH